MVAREDYDGNPVGNYFFSCQIAEVMNNAPNHFKYHSKAEHCALIGCCPWGLTIKSTFKRLVEMNNLNEDKKLHSANMVLQLTLIAKFQKKHANILHT